MLFKWILPSEWTIWCLLSIAFIIIAGVLFLRVQRTKMKDNALTPKKEAFKEECSKQEIIPKIQVAEFSSESNEILKKSPNLTPIEVLSSSTNERSEDPCSTPIDKLIEQGFIEKNSNDLEKAVFYFFKALSLDPKPDLAFYLIMDSYWLWNNLGKRDYALTQLQVYIQKYIPQFNPELRQQFDAWMTKEDLHKVG